MLLLHFSLCHVEPEGRRTPSQGEPGAQQRCRFAPHSAANVVCAPRPLTSLTLLLQASLGELPTKKQERVGELWPAAPAPDVIEVGVRYDFYTTDAPPGLVERLLARCAKTWAWTERTQATLKKCPTANPALRYNT